MFDDYWIAYVDWQSFTLEADLGIGMPDNPDGVVAVVGSYANLLPSGDLGAPRGRDGQTM